MKPLCTQGVDFCCLEVQSSGSAGHLVRRNAGRPCSCMPFVLGGALCVLCGVCWSRDRTFWCLAPPWPSSWSCRHHPLRSAVPTDGAACVFYLRPSKFFLSALSCLITPGVVAQRVSAAPTALSLIQRLPPCMRTGRSLPSLDSHLALQRCLGSPCWGTVQRRLEPDSQPESIHQLRLYCLLFCTLR